MPVLHKMARLPHRYPILRGMISYSVVWPCSSLVQEYLEYGVTLDEANWARAARFGLFGGLFISPAFYTWMKFTSPYFKEKTLATAMKRAAIEQVSYGPCALASFLFGMNIMEGKTVEQSTAVVKDNFWDTYKVGALYWPLAQTINFYFISENNRIIFVSVVSFIFTVFLAHMKSKSDDKTRTK